jgi:hypothetical protein
VLRQVEDGRDEGEGEEQEEDRVCLKWMVSLSVCLSVCLDGGWEEEGRDAQKKNFSMGVKM